MRCTFYRCRRAKNFLIVRVVFQFKSPLISVSVVIEYLNFVYLLYVFPHSDTHPFISHGTCKKDFAWCVVVDDIIYFYIESKYIINLNSPEIQANTQHKGQKQFSTRNGGGRGKVWL